MGQLDLNGFYDLVFSTVASLGLGIIILALFDGGIESFLGNIHWQVNFKSWLLQNIKLLKNIKILSQNIHKNTKKYFNLIKLFFIENDTI